MTTTIKSITADEMLAVINNPKENIGLFITTKSSGVITDVTIKTAGNNSGLPNNKVTVNEKPLYTVCDNTTGEAWTEETTEKFKALAFLGEFSEGDTFHCKCTICGIPINEVYHDYDNTLCEDCLQLEYPKQKYWKKAHKENPDECYYTEYSEDPEDQQLIVFVNENTDSPIDKFELIEYNANEQGVIYTTHSFVELDKKFVPADVLQWLEDNEPYIYMDTKINEHLFCDVREWHYENVVDEPFPDFMDAWQNKMDKVMEKYNAAYWRIIS